MDILELQAFLGHVSLLTTVRYTHLTTVTERQAAQRINHLMSRFDIRWGTVS